MAGFNPFAPQMDQKQQPQFQGVQAPNVSMQTQPGLMQTIGPAVAQQAMGSDMAGNVANSVVDTGVQGAKDVWGALTKSPQSPSTIPVSELSNTMGTVAQGSTALMGASPAAGFSAMASGGAEAAIAAEVAAASAAEAAAATALTGTAATAGGALASAAPAAALGPFGIPILIGAGLMAANSGK